MIPKIVHMAWKNKEVVNSQSPMVLNGLKNIIDLNPDWDIQISTDEEIEQYLKDNLSGEEYSLIADEGIVAKTDLWRLIKLYFVGGAYIDIDRLCNKPLSDLLEDGIKWVLPTYGDLCFSHDFMMTAPGNPAFCEVLELYLERRQQGWKHIFFLGPQTYMHGVSKALFNEIIDYNPGKEKFDQIREHLVNTKFIKTYKEDLPQDSMIYKGDITIDAWESMKRSFYAENGIKHWTGEW